MAAHGCLLVGAWSVMTTAHVDGAIDAGQTHLVSPGFSAAVVDRAMVRGGGARWTDDQV